MCCIIVVLLKYVFYVINVISIAYTYKVVIPNGSLLLESNFHGKKYIIYTKELKLGKATYFAINQMSQQCM